MTIRVKATQKAQAICLLGAVIAAALPGEVSSAISEPVVANQPLTPFRAVYELSLSGQEKSAGLSSLSGRMVHELAGSTCEGYSISQRMVTWSELSEGEEVIEDTQFAGFEDIQKGTYQFIARSTVGQEVVQQARGIARHKRAKTHLQMKLPEESEHDLPVNTLFPVAYVMELLETAKQGRRFLAAPLFDGSASGPEIYNTTATISAEKVRKKLVDTSDKTSKAVLQNRRYWPVTIAYFHKDENADGMEPSFEISFALYDNGMSDNLRFVYKEYVLVGKLKSLKLLPVTPCKTR